MKLNSIYKANDFKHWQQETEGGNPREKGNTRNEPQCTLGFSPWTHSSRLQQREVEPKQRALISMICKGGYWSSEQVKNLEFLGKGTRGKGIAEVWVGIPHGPGLKAGLHEGPANSKRPSREELLQAKSSTEVPGHSGLGEVEVLHSQSGETLLNITGIQLGSQEAHAIWIKNMP